jgi:hypothetical protein
MTEVLVVIFYDLCMKDYTILGARGYNMYYLGLIDTSSYILAIRDICSMSLDSGGHLVNWEGGVGCIPTPLPGAKYESEYILW